jgi:hypothetical protein
MDRIQNKTKNVEEDTQTHRKQGDLVCLPDTSRTAQKTKNMGATNSKAIS